jgi:hypothetical protein
MRQANLLTDPNQAKTDKLREHTILFIIIISKLNQLLLVLELGTVVLGSNGFHWQLEHKGG